MPKKKKKYLTRKEVAALYPISHSKLAHMAGSESGPPYYTPGRESVYVIEEFENWLVKQTSTSKLKKKFPKKIGRPRKEKEGK